MTSAANTIASRAPIGLVCPSCGNDGTRGVIRFVASPHSSAKILCLRRDVIELASPVARSNDNTDFPYLLCCATRRSSGPPCGHVWGLPDGVRGIAWRMGP